MTDAWQSIKVRSFEYVSASPSTSLLRLSGKPAWRQSSSQRPKLRLESARQTYHYAALPAPADPRGSLRAAYSVPSSLIETDSKFWLEHTDGSITELPYPTPGESRGAPTQDVHPAPTPRSGDPAAEQPEPHSDLHATLAAQSSELAEAQRAAAGNDQARRRAEAELARAQEGLAAARERADSLEQELTRLRGQLQELDTWRGELERRLTTTVNELGEARGAREADQREVKRLAQALAEAGSQENDRLGSAADSLAAQATEIELLMAELASVRAQRDAAVAGAGEPHSAGDGPA